MNYYKQFAEMLGLELEQEFVLTDDDGKRKDVYTYKITEDGVLYQKEYDFWILDPPITLACLLKGLYKAVPKPWKPKYGEQYWSYSTRINKACCGLFGEFVEDYAIWKSGNCFRTKEEAETKGKEIMEKLVKEYDEA